MLFSFKTAICLVWLPVDVIFFLNPLGAPVVASFPHFHLAEEKYVNAIKGMSPQWEHHQTFLDLNPVRLGGNFCLFTEFQYL